MTVTARAPGKLFLTGEWAVLRGAPAVVAAVDRIATVTLAPTPAAGLTVVSRADGESRFPQPDAGSLPGGDAGAVLAAWRAVGRHAFPGARVDVDAAMFLDGSRKLGLGRSAAVLAAMVAALGGTLEDALAAHARFQDGRGSGADVAAVWHGGVVEVRRTAGRVAVARRRLPPSLSLVVGWTGEGAATAPLLGRFEAAAASPALAALKLVAAEAAEAMAREDAERLRAAVARSAGLLARFGDEAGLPVVTPALARLIAAAEAAGAVAKPSGAGGGDCGIALVRSAAEADAVRAAWRAAGIVPLPLGIAAHGAVVAAGGGQRSGVSLA